MTVDDKKTGLNREPTNFVGIQFSLFWPVISEPGRHNVRIFSVPPEQMVLALTITFIVGFPSIFFIGLIPVWDFLGSLPLLKQFHDLIAPVLTGLPDVHLPAYPLKRTLIAIIFMIECFLLGNLLALGFRRVRRRALLVWRCYDRQKLLLYLFVSGIAFVFVWYFFFYDWRLLMWLAPKRRAGVGTIMYFALLLPITTLFFGHLVAIVAIGLTRMGYEELRRHRAIRRVSV